MSTLQALRSELVEKRLWPLVLVLIAALVAVPLLLTKSSPTPGTSETTAQADVSSHASGVAIPVVSLASATGQRAPLHGHPKDPFRQQHVPPKPSTAVHAKTPSTAATPDSSGSAGGGGATTTTPSHVAPAPSNPSPSYATASVDVRFGKATGKLRTIHDVPRLTPLPSAADPIVIFLGMRRDMKTAVFMISTDVRSQADGRCVPSKADCHAIELKADQVSLLDVTGTDGRVTQYELDLLNVTIGHTASLAKAKALYARVSKIGRRVLHRSAERVVIARAMHFSRRTGVLTPARGALASAARRLRIAAARHAPTASTSVPAP
jgi:hypothetical protein